MSTKRTLYMRREAVVRLSGGSTDPVVTGVELFTDDWDEAERRAKDLNQECRRTGNSDRFIHVDFTISLDQDKFPE